MQLPPVSGRCPYVQISICLDAFMLDSSLKKEDDDEPCQDRNIVGAYGGAMVRLDGGDKPY
ncbi:hypothetical protein Tco_1307359, partial [Tanacetum coccineum]